MLAHPTRCPDCGRLIDARTGKKFCSACTTRWMEIVARVEQAVEQRPNQTIEEVAQATGLSAAEVKRVAGDLPALRQQVVMRNLCVRCRREDAQPGTEYCPSCRLALYQELGQAADELLARLERLPIPYGTRSGMEVATGVDEAVKQKRARTGTSRLNPTPRGKYSPR